MNVFNSRSECLLSKDNQIVNFEFDVDKFTSEVNLLCELDLDFLEAVVHWCEKNSIEIETIIPIIRKDATLKARLTTVAENKNFLKKH